MMTIDEGFQGVSCLTETAPTSIAAGLSPRIIKCLRMQKACDTRPADQMTKSTLAVLEVDGAQVVAVELHEVERPEHEVGLGPFVHLPMELLETVKVYELGVDDGGSSQRCECSS